MKTETQVKAQPKKAAQKKIIIKWSVIGTVALAVIVTAAIVLPKVFAKDASTRIVTYNVTEVTTGNVSTTVSGSGNLTPITKQTVSAEYGGEVTSVAASIGAEVAEGDAIATVTYSIGPSTNTAEITAPFDGILIELPVAEGDTFAQGDELCMLMGKDGFIMGVAVDELNIAAIQMGQEVTYTIDALSGSYSGTVTAISYNGSTSGSVTAYQIQTTLDYIEGAYPGMSASAQIVIEDSGEGLLVPVDAVYTSGDTNYVYLAPSDAETGTAYDEDAIDLNKMTKVTVTAGMSDGSYMRVDSDDLAEGDRILVKQVTSSATESARDSRDSSGFPGGGFPGGGDFPGGSGGFDFGDFDFSNFDPSDRPSGGFSGFGK